MWCLCCSSKTQSGACDTIIWEQRPDQSRPLSSGKDSVLSEQQPGHGSYSQSADAVVLPLHFCLQLAPTFTQHLPQIPFGVSDMFVKDLDPSAPPVLQRESSWIRQDYMLVQGLCSQHRETKRTRAGREQKEEEEEEFSSGSKALNLHLYVCFELRPEGGGSFYSSQRRNNKNNRGWQITLLSRTPSYVFQVLN